MSLVQCPECGSSRSDQAAICLSCGCPVKKAAGIPIVRKQFEVLLILPMVFHILAWLTAIAGVVAVFIIASQMPVPYRIWMAIYTAIATGIQFVFLLAGGEMIMLMLALEEHSRAMRMMMEQQMKTH